MGYVVIDIEADEDVAEKALQSMKAIPGRFARLLPRVRFVVSVAATPYLTYVDCTPVSPFPQL